MKVNIYWPAGCAPYTDNVSLWNANSHVAANDRLSLEAELLLLREADLTPDGWRLVADCECGDTNDDPAWIETWEYIN